MWDYLSKTEELSPQEKIDRWIFGSQVGSMDQMTLSNYWSPLNHQIHGNNGQTSSLQNCRAGWRVLLLEGRHNISHIRIWSGTSLTLPYKVHKTAPHMMVRKCNSLDHISWRIEISCLIMSKLDLATMLHMWSNGLEGTVTPPKNLSAVRNGSVPGRMCSYREHKLQEECLLMNANSWQGGLILKPASIWCIFNRHYFRMEDLDASCNKNWTMGCDHGVPCEEQMQCCSTLPENEVQMLALI